MTTPSHESDRECRVGLCDDGDEPWCLGEPSLFRGRTDEWFLLTWWGPTIGWSVEETLGCSMYACDSGPLGTPLADLIDALKAFTRAQSLPPRAGRGAAFDVAWERAHRALARAVPGHSLPAAYSHPDSCEHGRRLKNDCRECAAMIGGGR